MSLDNTNKIYTETQPCIDSYTKKLLIIFITVLFMMLPIAFISRIISERENFKTEAIQNVMSSWAEEQVIDVPTMYFTDSTKNNEETAKYFCLDKYDIVINVNTEIRKKGIFNIPVYIANVTQKGNFINNFDNIENKNTFVKFGITDARGFMDEPILKVANQSPQKLLDTYAKVSINSGNKVIPFELSYRVKGVNSIKILLGGINNTISMQSNWTTPSFEGSFLPSNREINNNGFQANWLIPNIALQTNNGPAFISVSLLVPVDSYRMASRVLKYSFLLLTLSFLCYFIYEITSKQKNRIHPIQYCLLGAAILIFYLLLVSISEFLPFLVAYLIATLMTLSMIFLYTYFIITKSKNMQFSIAITLIIGILYLFFYILLQLQDIALLTGSLALFVIVGVIMYFTRNIDWYKNQD